MNQSTLKVLLDWSAAREPRDEPGGSLGESGPSRPDDPAVESFLSAPAFAGANRGFGGGRYAAPYSGCYGGEFRNDYRGTRANGSERFPRLAGHRDL